MMIGGPKAAIDHLDPIFKALAPGVGTIRRTPDRAQRTIPAPNAAISTQDRPAPGTSSRWSTTASSIGLMQAYAEGFDILRNKTRPGSPEDERFCSILPDIAEVWRRGSVISSWLLDLGAAALAKDPKLRNSPVTFRLGRGPMDCRGRDRGSCPGRRTAAALFARIRSRQEHTFGEKMLSAMRLGFGGHMRATNRLIPKPAHPAYRRPSSTPAPKTKR